MNNHEKCDMCGSAIKDGECSCGTWKSAEEMKDCPMKLGLEKFHEMKQMTFSGDSPHLGCAVLYFRGDMRDCEHLKKVFYLMKGRSHYEE